MNSLDDRQAAPYDSYITNEYHYEGMSSMEYPGDPNAGLLKTYVSDFKKPSTLLRKATYVSYGQADTYEWTEEVDWYTQPVPITQGNYLEEDVVNEVRVCSKRVWKTDPLYWGAQSITKDEEVRELKNEYTTAQLKTELKTDFDNCVMSVMRPEKYCWNDNFDYPIEYWPPDWKSEQGLNLSGPLPKSPESFLFNGRIEVPSRAGPAVERILEYPTSSSAFSSDSDLCRIALNVISSDETVCGKRSSRYRLYARNEEDGVVRTFHFRWLEIFFPQNDDGSWGRPYLLKEANHLIETEKTWAYTPVYEVGAPDSRGVTCVMLYNPLFDIQQSPKVDSNTLYLDSYDYKSLPSPSVTLVKPEITDGATRVQLLAVGGVSPTFITDQTNVRFLYDTPNGAMICGLQSGSKVDIEVPLDIDGANIKATHTVYVCDLKLLCDGNRDGVIGVEGGEAEEADVTTKQAPLRFWINDDNDRCTSSYGTGAGYTENAEDLLETGVQGYSFDTIQSARDLEDFARLWINTQGLNASFKNGDLYLGLRWADEGKTGAPAIKLFKHVESGGGLGYLNDWAVVSQQLQERAIHDERFGSLSPVFWRYTVDGSDVFVLPSTVFSQLSETAPTTHLLFEGAGVGKGQLKLVILKKDGDNFTAIGEGPGVWFDLKNIKSMYGRTKVIPRDPNGIPAPFTNGVFDANGASVESSDDGYPFAAPPDEAKTSTVFVHGSNISYESAKSDAETMFKRLWWQGYKGRLVLLYWNTLVGPFDGAIPAHYNLNEYRALKYGLALKNYIENSLPADYAHNVVGHSLGNGVIVSALHSRVTENGSTISGMAARNVIFMQAAMPASCFDSNAAPLAELAALESPQATPDGVNQMGYRGAAEASIHANLFSIYNENDYALGWWVTNQRFMKPENLNYRNYSRGYTWSTNAGKGQLWEGTNNTGWSLLRDVVDGDESMAFISRSRTSALGRMNVGGSISGNLNISVGTEVDFGSERPDHSGEFTRPIQKLAPFYRYLFERVR